MLFKAHYLIPNKAHYIIPNKVHSVQSSYHSQMPKKEETGPKQPKETRKKRPKSSKEHYEHCKPASVAAPAFRSGLQKPTEYSANWKALSKVNLTVVASRETDSVLQKPDPIPWSGFPWLNGCCGT